jgi:hypothetical protein
MCFYQSIKAVLNHIYEATRPVLRGKQGNRLREEYRKNQELVPMRDELLGSHG